MGGHNLKGVGKWGGGAGTLGPALPGRAPPGPGGCVLEGPHAPACWVAVRRAIEVSVPSALSSVRTPAWHCGAPAIRQRTERRQGALVAAAEVVDVALGPAATVPGRAIRRRGCHASALPAASPTASASQSAHSP